MGACAGLWPLCQDSASHVAEQLREKTWADKAQGVKLRQGLKEGNRDVKKVFK